MTDDLRAQVAQAHRTVPLLLAPLMSLLLATLAGLAVAPLLFVPAVLLCWRLLADPALSPAPTVRAP